MARVQIQVALSFILLIGLIYFGVFLFTAADSISCRDAFIAGDGCTDCVFEDPLGQCLERISNPLDHQVDIILSNRLTGTVYVETLTAHIGNSSCNMTINTDGRWIDPRPSDRVQWDMLMFATLRINCDKPGVATMEMLYRMAGSNTLHGMQGRVIIP